MNAAWTQSSSWKRTRVQYVCCGQVLVSDETSGRSGSTWQTLICLGSTFKLSYISVPTFLSTSRTSSKSLFSWTQFCEPILSILSCKKARSKPSSPSSSQYIWNLHGYWQGGYKRGLSSGQKREHQMCGIGIESFWGLMFQISLSISCQRSGPLVSSQ